MAGEIELIPPDVLKLIAAFAEYDSLEDKIINECVRCKYAAGQFIMHVNLFADKVADLEISFRFELDRPIKADSTLIDQRIIFVREKNGGECKVQYNGDVKFQYDSNGVKFLMFIEETKLRQMFYCAYHNVTAKAIHDRDILLLCKCINLNNSKKCRGNVYDYLRLYNCNPQESLDHLYANCNFEFSINNKHIAISVSINLYAKIHKSTHTVLGVYIEDSAAKVVGDTMIGSRNATAKMLLFLSAANYSLCYDNRLIEMYLS